MDLLWETSVKLSPWMYIICTIAGCLLKPWFIWHWIVKAQVDKFTQKLSNMIPKNSIILQFKNGKSNINLVQHYLQTLNTLIAHLNFLSIYNKATITNTKVFTNVKSVILIKIHSFTWLFHVPLYNFVFQFLKSKCIYLDRKVLIYNDISDIKQYKHLSSYDIWDKTCNNIY